MATRRRRRRPHPRAMCSRGIRSRCGVLRAGAARDAAHAGEHMTARLDQDLVGRSTGLSRPPGSRRQPARRTRRVRVDRVVDVVEDLRSRMSARSALFTARPFGNAFATCGSRTTTFVASATRRAYFPRARRPKSERLYSGRRPSDRFLFALLIDLPLRAWRRCRPPWPGATRRALRAPLCARRNDAVVTLRGEGFSSQRAQMDTFGVSA
jgi:hypothetical protein